MTVPGSLTIEEVAETRRIVWAPHYRLNYVNNYWTRHLFQLMACVFVASTVCVPLAKAHPRLAGWLTALLVCAAVAVAVFFGQRLTPKKLASINANQPTSFRFDETGVHAEAATGIAHPFPWKAFKGWYDGQSILVLDGFGYDDAVPIPLNQLSSEARAGLRSLVASHLGPASPVPD